MLAQSNCQLFLQSCCQLMPRNCRRSMRENIHQTIAAVLALLFHNPPTSHVITAPECGGNHRIRLFSTQSRSRATNYCWPDLAIAQDGEIRVILEIEDAGIVSPGRIGGKLLPVSLSTCLLNEEVAATRYPSATKSPSFKSSTRLCSNPQLENCSSTKTWRPTSEGSCPSDVWFVTS